MTVAGSLCFRPNFLTRSIFWYRIFETIIINYSGVSIFRIIPEIRILATQGRFWDQCKSDEFFLGGGGLTFSFERPIIWERIIYGIPEIFTRYRFRSFSALWFDQFGIHSLSLRHFQIITYLIDVQSVCTVYIQTAFAT